jgi:hypothetical protein
MHYLPFCHPCSHFPTPLCGFQEFSSLQHLLIGNEPWANITSQHDSKNSSTTFRNNFKIWINYRIGSSILKSNEGISKSFQRNQWIAQT